MALNGLLTGLRQPPGVADTSRQFYECVRRATDTSARHLTRCIDTFACGAALLSFTASENDYCPVLHA
ncbi:jg20420 [Pararge aegeria aegeria]|uniref:Jg20420 protein n=1 Tax=Pararge aegeria aegeria TaxID=348720 RepID=A0A8S4QDE4_9NEOP|nr:jg20420 [Pararge aegeria aegeria]